MCRTRALLEAFADALQALVEQAGLRGVKFTEVLRVHRCNGREYPLFQMTGRKP